MGLLDKLLRARTEPSQAPTQAESSAASASMPADELSDELSESEFSEFGPSQFGDSMVSPLQSAAGQSPQPPSTAPRQGVQPSGRNTTRINPRSGTRVLIVDESYALISGMRRLLRQNQLQPIEAVGGEHGLELALSREPELIFLSVALPGMSGFNVLRALRRNPGTRDVPVVMMSSNAQATEASYLQRLGADGFLIKPFSRADVFGCIEGLLDAERIPRRPGQTRTAEDDEAAA